MYSFKLICSAWELQIHYFSFGCDAKGLKTDLGVYRLGWRLGICGAWGRCWCSSWDGSSNTTCWLLLVIHWGWTRGIRLRHELDWKEQSSVTLDSETGGSFCIIKELTHSVRTPLPGGFSLPHASANHVKWQLLPLFLPTEKLTSAAMIVSCF